MANKQAAYFGLKNVKYAMEGGNLAPMPFALNLSLEPQVSTTPLYADDEKIFEVPSDKGYSGTLGLSNLDAEYEIALGYAAKMADESIATLDALAMKKHDIYFETTGANEDGSTFLIKAWMLDVTTAKAGKNYTTKGEDLEFGAHELPITIYGRQVLDADGKAYVDEETGFTRKVFILTSRPGDAGYDTFGDAVPEPKMAAQEQTQNP